MLVIAVLLIAAACAAVYFTRRADQTAFNVMVQTYENSLAWERTRVDNLLVQVQANSQGMQHYPSFGPADTAPLERSLTDDFGFDTGLEASDDDRDFVDAATV